MLHGLPILIADDEPLLAIDLARTVRHLHGHAIGPVDSVADGLELLKIYPVLAAILDANLRDRDVTPLALALVERAVPFVIYSGEGLPAALAAHHPHLPVVMKPARSSAVLAALIQQVPRERIRPDQRRRERWS